MGTLITDGFDPGDDERAVSILKKWKGGVLSDQLFTTISKMGPQVGVITILFRKNDKILEVLLLPRPKDDPLWPGMLNLPGKMLRSADFKREDGNPVNGPFERIETNEVKAKFASEPVFAGLAFQSTDRGPILALVYIAELAGNQDSQKDYVWADANKLEDIKNLIKTEIIAVNVALKSYLASLHSQHILDKP